MVVRTVTQCNKLFSAKTPHPLVAVIRLSDTVDIPDLFQFCFHSIWIRKWTGQTPSCFGGKECDFNEKTLLALQSGTPVSRDLFESKAGKSDGLLLCFHSSIFNPFKTGKEMRYSFFRYKMDESLHLSQREQAIVERELFEIEEELYWGVDEYSNTILSERIKLLLDYISRFYKRQFILRHDDNQDMINRTDEWLDEFFGSGKCRYMPLPTTLDFAGMFGCSPDYFNDLLKHETGKNTEDYINFKRIARAENLLKQGIMRVEEVAAELGFSTDSAFCVLFKKLRGEMPQKMILGSNTDLLS